MENRKIAITGITVLNMLANTQESLKRNKNSNNKNSNFICIKLKNYVTKLG